MSGTPTRISPEDLKKITDHLDKVWKRNGCPICKKRAWVIPGYSFIPTVSQVEKVMRFGTSFLPLIPVVCTHCGYTALVNAVVAGVVDENGDPT